MSSLPYPPDTLEKLSEHTNVMDAIYEWPSFSLKILKFIKNIILLFFSYLTKSTKAGNIRL